MRIAAAIVAGLLALGACGQKEPDVAIPATPGPFATKPEIAAADIAARVKELADDKYEGRGPGTQAGEAAAQWIADEMKRIGLKPGNGESWFQTVEMVAQTTNVARSILQVTGGASPIDLKIGPDAVFNTPIQDKTEVVLPESEMIFVGYGVVAPEANWNDYAGIDARGKTVVMFVNDPGFATGDDTLFNGQAMTYYGRWTYKFEEAGRQGAAAVLLIHEDKPASYGWEVVLGSWSGEQANLQLADAGASLADVQGWISLPVATRLFQAAGMDIDALRAAANKPGFKPQPIKGLKLSGRILQSAERRQSRNVVGALPGAKTPDEHALFMAHWDHLGRKEAGAPGEDLIYNGAVDNATGVAMILEIAERFASLPPPDRSVTFLAVTLEESGLLGSAYFANNPFIPLNKIAGGINLDALNPIGPTRDAIVIGAGASELEDLLSDALAVTNRVLRPDPEPEAGYFYRSDHISLAKKGVPMLYIDGGIDAVDGGEARGLEVGETYRREHYHKPSDEFRADWDFAGLEADAVVSYEVARRIAASGYWPAWRPGNEFRAAREKSLAGN